MTNLGRIVLVVFGVVAGGVVGGGFVACKSSTTTTTNGAGASASASGSSSASAGPMATKPSTSASASAAKIVEVPTRAVPGVGNVPLWSAERRRAPCELEKAAKDRIAALTKGDDATIADGSTDPARLVADIAGECFVARRALAEALTEGGERWYEKKKWAEADHWFAAALYARPELDAARYDLACSLALGGDRASALWALSELARAARDTDPEASNFLERAKSDPALASVRDDPAFKDAVAASVGVLVGPTKDAALANEIVTLLPPDFRVGPNPATGGMRQYHPAVVDLWTWRPDASTELTLATIICDPAVLTKPPGDVTSDYGAIAVVRRQAGKTDLLHLEKIGSTLPVVAPTKGGGVVFKFSEGCGDLKGVMHWKDGKVEASEQSCKELPP